MTFNSLLIVLFSVLLIVCINQEEFCHVFNEHPKSKMTPGQESFPSRFSSFFWAACKLG